MAIAMMLGLCASCGSAIEDERDIKSDLVEATSIQPEPEPEPEPAPAQAHSKDVVQPSVAIEEAGVKTPKPLFVWADLGKPIMEGTPPIDPYLAPLIYFEADAPGADTRSASSGEFPIAGLEPDATGAAAPAGAPVIYVHDAQVDLRGAQYRQLTFIWFANATQAAQLKPNALRLTLRSNGFPGVYELLQTSPAQRRLWVVEGLESLAAATFGAPLDGNQHAIEATQALAIEGILPDGPVPMGPYVYVSKQQPALRALHCRCTPTLAANIRRPFEYELRSIDQLDGLISESQSAAAWLAASFGAGDAIAESLRLPESF